MEQASAAARFGDDGSGTFTIASGASVTSGTANFGLSNALLGAVGTATISGDTSSWTVTGGLTLGGASSASNGQGVLNVQGGTVGVSGTLSVGVSNSSKLTLSGGTLSVGSLDLSSTPANFSWTGGTLALTGSSLTIGSSGLLGSSTSSMTGNLEGLEVTGTGKTLTLAAGSTLTNSGYIEVYDMNIASGTFGEQRHTRDQPHSHDRQSDHFWNGH